MLHPFVKAFHRHALVFAMGKHLISPDDPPGARKSFKGTKAPKSKFKFALRDEPWFCFAGLWIPGTPEKGEAFTLLATEPGPDVAAIHSRQMAVLKCEDWKSWLDLLKPEHELLKAFPGGSLTVEQVR